MESESDAIPMFDTPRLVQNTFSVFFRRRPAIRREANRFEDLFRTNYGPPQVLGVPDELDPEIPRIIFSSRHGFSQIVISEVSLSLFVNYSPDWQLDRQRANEYLEERVPALYRALQELPTDGPIFAGVISRVRIPVSKNEDPPTVFSRLFPGRPSEGDEYDLEMKTVRVVDRKYFSNLVLETYRVWSVDSPSPEILRLPMSGVRERGIQILSDLNDRFAFNEQEAYVSDAGAAVELLRRGRSEVELQIGRLLNGKSR